MQHVGGVLEANGSSYIDPLSSTLNHDFSDYITVSAMEIYFRIGQNSSAAWRQFP
jgi:hypothetical protein